MDRQTKKRITSRISNFLWSTGIMIAILLLVWKALPAFFSWKDAMGTAID
jgi:hypothetical protein